LPGTSSSAAASMIANSARYSAATPRPTVAAVTILNKATCSRAAGCGLRSHSPVATTIVTVMPATEPRAMTVSRGGPR
jgi:hypothetical protein